MNTRGSLALAVLKIRLLQDLDNGKLSLNVYNTMTAKNSFLHHIQSEEAKEYRKGIIEYNYKALCKYFDIAEEETTSTEYQNSLTKVIDACITYVAYDICNKIADDMASKSSFIIKYIPKKPN